MAQIEVLRQTLAASALAAACVLAAPAAAQLGASRAVVQPLPPPEAAQLSEALRRLATNPRDLDALISAGTASLKLDDVDAALGFFGRADEIAPGNPRAKAGLAAAMVKEENPFDALRLFDEAERAGAPMDEVASERGLAYDLVGNTARAQELYRQVLARGEDAETSRRLAVSLAISGDQAGMERVLLPMLQRRDLAAYRSRAFALAILGKVEEAQTISDAVMPASMAARVAPYLRYMPRLTPAQQAAAANLGNFPRTADIGRDDARIAQYAGEGSASAAPPVRSADARLVPSGEPLGPATAAIDDGGRRRPDRPEAERVALVEVARAEPEVAAAPESRSEPVPEPQPQLTQVALAEPPPAAALQPVSEPAPPAQSQLTQIALAEPARSTVQPGQAAEAPRPAFDLGQLSGSRVAVEQVAAAPAETVPSPAVAEPEPRLVQAVAVEAPLAAAGQPEASPPPNVANAFADFELALAPTVPAAGAVDLSKISAPRERPAPKEPAKPAPPKHPSRYWVQLATGKDRARLGSDFRRISGNSKGLLKDAKGYLADWGETNRLLTGPFRNEAAARALVTKLDEAGLKTFTFTSKEGEEVTALAAR